MRKKGRTAGRGPVRGRAAWTQVATLFRFRGRLCYFGYDQGNSKTQQGRHGASSSPELPRYIAKIAIKHYFI